MKTRKYLYRHFLEIYQKIIFENDAETLFSRSNPGNGRKWPADRAHPRANLPPDNEALFDEFGRTRSVEDLIGLAAENHPRPPVGALVGQRECLGLFVAAGLLKP